LWCDQNYSHEGRNRYEVHPDKIIRYFKDNVYDKKIKKYYNRNKSYIRVDPDYHDLCKLARIVIDIYLLASQCNETNYY
jgi:hypothetical protein